MSALKQYTDGDRVRLARCLAADPENVRRHLGRTGVVRCIDREGIYHVELEPLAGEFGVHIVEVVPLNLDPAPAAAAAGPAHDPVYVAANRQVARLAELGEAMLEQRARHEALHAAAGDAVLRAWWAKAVAGAAPYFGPLADRLADVPPEGFRLTSDGSGPARFEVRVRPYGEVWVGLAMQRTPDGYAPLGLLPNFRVPTEWTPSTRATGPIPRRLVDTPHLAEAVALARRAEPAYERALAESDKLAAQADKPGEDLIAALAEALVARMGRPTARCDGNGHAAGTERAVAR